MPVATRQAKAEKEGARAKAVFQLFTLGVVTNRDDWVYDDDPDHLVKKVRFFIERYNSEVERLRSVRDSKELDGMLDGTIKWTRAVKADLRKALHYRFDQRCVCQSYYRPFVKRHMYFSRNVNEMVYKVPQLFGPTAGPNQA
jgi:predicted helicase